MNLYEKCHQKSFFPEDMSIHNIIFKIPINDVSRHCQRFYIFAYVTKYWPQNSISACITKTLVWMSEFDMHPQNTQIATCLLLVNAANVVQLKNNNK